MTTCIKFFIAFALLIDLIAFCLWIVFGFICLVATAMVATTLYCEGAFDRPKKSQP